MTKVNVDECPIFIALSFGMFARTDFLLTIIHEVHMCLYVDITSICQYILYECRNCSCKNLFTIIKFFF